MTYKQLFILFSASTILNAVLLIANSGDNSSKTPKETRWVTHCKTCEKFNFKDLEEAQKEFTKVKFQQWYKKQVERRNDMIQRAILNGDWTPGCTVPPILTEEAKMIPGFADLFDSAK